MAEKTVKSRVQIKRGTSAEWALATNFRPLDGEIIFYSDLNKIKIGKKDSNGNLILLSDLPFVHVDKSEIDNFAHNHNDIYYNKGEVDSKLATKSDYHEHPYAPDNHNHDDKYSKLGHNHDDKYAEKSHNHDSDYAAKNHNHDDKYYTIGAVDSLLSTKLDANSELNASNISGRFTKSVVPAANGAIDLGEEGTKWKDLYLSGSLTYTTQTGPDTFEDKTKVSAEGILLTNGAVLTDGTNSYTIADIASMEDDIANHNHNTIYYSKSEVDSKLETKSSEGHKHDSSYAPLNHNHDNVYSKTDHNHDEQYAKKGHDHATIYYTKGDVDAKLSEKANAEHGLHVTFTTNNPVMDGTASAGEATTVARSDHKHPVDTSRAAAEHKHTKSEITDFDHNHDTRYYTKNEVNAELVKKADTEHNHPYLPDTTKYAGSATKGGPANSVANSITVQLNSGTTEGTDKFTFDGSAEKTINITPSKLNVYTKNEVESELQKKAATGHTHAYLPDSTTYAGSTTQGGAANSVKSSIKFTADGKGAASNATFDGSAEKTISYNTIGAAKEGHNHDTVYYTKNDVNSLLAAKSPEGHKHDDDYAPLNHTHTEYAEKEHSHENDYAAKEHDHDDDYALKGHDHDTVYAKKGDLEAGLKTKAPADHKHNYAGSASEGGPANSVKSALTFSTSGNGAASGTTFDGSTTRTISYNSVGAAPTSHKHTRSDITDFDSHNHDTVYAKKGDLEAGLKTKADVDHTHPELITSEDVTKQINNAVSSVLKYQGSKNTTADLPTSGQVKGDVWNITNECVADSTKGLPKVNAGDNVAWNGTGWDVLAGTVDLSNYYTKGEVNAELQKKADVNHGVHVSYSTTGPVMDGAASAGSATTVARSDHRHPVDTSRAPVKHEHTKSEITDFGHDHDTRYYTKGEVNAELEKYSKIGHNHSTSTSDAAPNAHTHTLKVSGTTDTNNGTAVKAVLGYEKFSGGSGSLEAYDAVTGGTKTVSNGDRIPVVTSITHTNSSLGTANTSNAAPGEHKHTYAKTTGVGLTANTETATGRIKYVESISSTGASASGTGKAGSETHTHIYSKTTGIKLQASLEDATGRITYVESISGSAPSLTGTKTFVTGVTKGSGDLISNGTASGGIKYIESCGTFSQGTLPGLTITSKSPSKITAWSAGSVPSLTITSKSPSKISAWSAGSAPSLTYSTESVGSASGWSAGTMFSASVSGTTLTLTAGSTPSLTITKKSPSKITAWDAGSTPSLTYAAEAVGSASGWSAGSTPSLSYETVSVGSASGWSAGTLPTMGACTTKYLHHTHTSASSSGTGTVGIANGSYTATTKYLNAIPRTSPVASDVPSDTTEFVTGVTGGTTKSTTRYLSAAPSHTSTNTGNNDGTNFEAVTGYPGFTGGGVSATTYYLAHNHAPASLGTATTEDVTPFAHTHAYGSTTALTTSANSGNAVKAVTVVNASTD